MNKLSQLTVLPLITLLAGPRTQPKHIQHTNRKGALKFIEESKWQPFFLYCALPVPHGEYSFGYNQLKRMAAA